MAVFAYQSLVSDSHFLYGTRFRENE